MALLPTRTLKPIIGNDYIVHVVDPADTTDAASGSSFQAVLAESFLPLGGTKTGFPIIGTVEIDPAATRFFEQMGAVKNNYIRFFVDTSISLLSEDVGTSDFYELDVLSNEINFKRNNNKVGTIDEDENFGIGQNTISAEYQINSVRALSTRGTQNLWVGNAGNTTSTGVQNTCVGLRAGEALTTGAENVMIGQVCGVLITTGSRNTLFGKQTAYVATTGSDNLFAGYRAGYTLTTGSENTLIGRSSGGQLTTGSKNVFVGYSTGFDTATQRTISGAFGYAATVDQDNSIVIGGAYNGSNFARVGLGIVAPTAWLHVPPSTTSYASLRVPSGTAPTSPNDGDIWFDGTNIKIRVSGVTKTFTIV